MSDQQRPTDPMIGKTIAERYIVDSVLGEGGMGILYLSHHKTLNNKFVIKLIRTEALGLNAEVYLRRFKREARAVAKVNHPNVVKVVDYDILEGRVPYIIMDFVEGEPLSDFIGKNPSGLPFELVRLFMKQLCQAMSAVHASGIIHRDIKPSNIMVRLGEDGDYQLTVLDFGLVHTDQKDIETAKLRLTATGQLLGTPYYMSPEQCRGESLAPSTDVYNLGLIAYELVTGMQAIDGTGFLDVVRRQIMEPPEPIETIRSDTPPSIIAAINKALVKDPTERFDSCRAFYEAIADHVLDTTGTLPVYRPKSEPVPATPPIKKSRAWLWLAAALILTAIGAWQFWPRAQPDPGVVTQQQTTPVVTGMERYYEQIKSIQLEHTDLVSVRFLPRHPHVVLAFRSGLVQIIDRRTGNTIQRLKPFDRANKSLGTNGDGTQLFILSGDRCRIAKVDLETYHVEESDLCQQIDVPAVLAMGRIGDARDPKTLFLTTQGLRTFSGDLATDMDDIQRGVVVVSPDARVMAIINDGKHISVYEASTLNKVMEQNIEGKGRILSASFSEDNRYLICGTVAGEVVLIDLKKNRTIQAQHHNTWITAINIFESHDRIWSYAQDGQVHLLSVPDLTPLDSFETPVNTMTAWDNNGHMAIADSLAGTVTIYRIRNPFVQARIKVSDFPIWDVAVRPDGSQAFASGAGTNIEVIELEKGKRSQSLSFHRDGVTRLKMFQNGTRMLSASDDFQLGLWDLEQLSLIHSVRAHNDLVNAVDVHPNESMCATTSSDRLIKLWLLPDLTLVKEITELPASSSSIGFSPSGRFLAAADWGGKLVVIETSQYRPMAELNLSDKGIYWLQFFPNDDNKILVNDHVGLAYVVEIEGNQLRSKLLRHQIGSRFVANSFSNWKDHNCFAVVGEGSIQIHDLNSMDLIHRFRGLPTAQVGFFHPNRPTFHVGTSDGTLIQLDLSSWISLQ